MEKSEHHDYAISMRFKWDKTKRNKTLTFILSAKMPTYDPDYVILTKQETDKKINELLDDINRITWNKVDDVYYVKDNVEKQEFIFNMNSKWSKEEESDYLNKRLRTIVNEILCY